IMSASLRLGVTTSGIVANGGLTSFNPQTLPIENNYPIAAALRRRLGVHALVVNDAQAAAFHESRLMRKDANSFAFITVSTDIGAGLVLDGQLQIGRRGLAGRAGHITVDWAGRLCGCGRRGCVETLASGAAIARRASEITGQEMMSRRRHRDGAGVPEPPPHRRGTPARSLSPSRGTGARGRQCGASRRSRPSR
ncbi:MAG: ROK family protein, partial [Alphaproteobacteria bacterium]